MTAWDGLSVTRSLVWMLLISIHIYVCIYIYISINYSTLSLWLPGACGFFGSFIFVHVIYRSIHVRATDLCTERELSAMSSWVQFAGWKRIATSCSRGFGLDGFWFILDQKYTTLTRQWMSFHWCWSSGFCTLSSSYKRIGVPETNSQCMFSTL